MKFLSELKRFEAEHPPGVGPAVVDPKAAAATLGAQPGEGAKPAEAAKPGEGAQPAEAATTPRALAEMLDSKPALKAALEADPDAKGMIFANARKLAELEPIAALIPTKADAEFALEAQSALIGLKTASMRLINAPESAPQVLDMLDSQFAIVDKEGKPVLGADGKPSYAADRTPFLHAVVDREMQGYVRQFGTELATLKQKLDTAAYPNEQAKAIDQQRYDNLEYAHTWAQMWEAIRTGEFFKTAAPTIPDDAPQHVKDWFIQQQQELADKEAALNGTKSAQSKEENLKASTQYRTNIRIDQGTSAGQVLAEQLNAAVTSGRYIPEFYLQQKWINPQGQQTETADIAARIFLEFDKELNRPGSRTLMEIAQHELLPENDQTRAIRKDWYARKAAELVPGLVTKELERIDKLVLLDQDKMETRLKERGRQAQPEPVSGGNGLPQGASQEQLMQQAEALAKQDPGFQGASPGDKQARILTKLHQLTPRNK
jgi:hypothetical protein